MSVDESKKRMTNMQSASLLDPEEPIQLSGKPQCTFQSSVKREFLDSVSKEIRVNPGPGSYIHD